MSLNCREIEKILNELPLKDSLIQDIVQPAFNTLLFYLYSRKSGGSGANRWTLIVDFTQGQVRINATTHSYKKREKPLRFMECLRSSIRALRILEVKQVNFSRLLVFNIGGKESLLYRLYIRLWDNAGNVLLCRPDNYIIDAMYRRVKKGEVKGKYFDLSPYSSSESTSYIEGFNPSYIEGFRKNFNYPIRSYGGKEATFSKEGKEGVSYNQIVDDYFFQKNTSSVLQDSATFLNESYKKAFNTLTNSLKSLNLKYNSFNLSYSYLKMGHLIIENISSIPPNASSVKVYDYEASSYVSVPLNKNLSAASNAQNYFTSYKKALRGQKKVLEEIKDVSKKITTLEERYKTFLVTGDREALLNFLKAAVPNKKEAKTPSSFPCLSYFYKGYLLLVGRNATENDTLLRHYAKAGDLWFHARGVAAAYVYVRKVSTPLLNSKEKVSKNEVKSKKEKGKKAKLQYYHALPPAVLTLASSLALYHSAKRKEGKGDLYCTYVKYLRRVKKIINGRRVAIKGLVTPENEKNLFAALDLDSIKRAEEERKNEEEM